MAAIFVVGLLLFLVAAVIVYSGLGKMDPATGRVSLTSNDEKPATTTGSTDTTPPPPAPSGTTPPPAPSGTTAPAARPSAPSAPSGPTLPVSAAERSAMDKFKQTAPKLVEALALGMAKDWVLLFGASLVATASREIAESGVKTGLKQTAKIVSSQGADVAMKFFGFASKEAVDKSLKMAAGSSAEKAARMAAKSVLDDAVARAGAGIAEPVAKAAAEKVAREAAMQAAEAAGERAAAGEIARVAAMKGAKSTAEKQTVKLVAKVGPRAAATAGKAGVMAAKAGNMLAKMVSMGPISALLMAVDIVSLALDLACCGGYCQVVEAGKYEKTRDEFKGNVQVYLDDTNKELVAAGEEVITWPIVWGPIDKLDTATLNQKLGAKVDEIMNDPTHPVMAPLVTKLRDAVAAGRVTTSDQISAFITENVESAALAEAAKMKLCPEVGGKIVDNKWCSWDTKAACEGSFKWPIGETNKTDHYVTWDQTKQVCNKDPLSGLMRGVCEGTKGKDSDAGFPWDPVKNTCTINEAYCLGKSMQWDRVGNKCTLSKGQEVAETLFGTTMVRGLNQLYDAKQYEDCPPGSRPAGEIAALAGVGMAMGAAVACVVSVGVACAAAVAGTVVGATYLGQTMCSTDKCPDGQARQSGLCYPECKKATPEEKAMGWDDYTAKAMDTPGAQGVMIQGMCYRCPAGYYKSSPGMCQRKTNTTLGTMSICPNDFTDSGLFCNVKTRNIGMGTAKACQKTGRGLCHSGRPWTCSGGVRQDVDGLCYNPCNTGEVRVPGMPYLCRTGGGPLVQEKIKMGVCPPDKDRVGAQCFKKCSEYGPGWVRTVEGTCAAKQWGGADVIATAGKNELSYSREPLGISYKVFPKKRKIPLGKGPKGC